MRLERARGGGGVVDAVRVGGRRSRGVAPLERRRRPGMVRRRLLLRGLLLVALLLRCGILCVRRACEREAAEVEVESGRHGGGGSDRGKRRPKRPAAILRGDGLAMRPT